LGSEIRVRTSALLGFVMRRLGTYFVARHEALRGIEDTQTVAAAVARGETVGFFPEGTFSRAPGVAPFRLGAFAVAAETRTPVVPVILSGTRSPLREGRWLPERHKVTVSVQPPLMAEGQDWSSAVRLRDAARAIVTHCTEPDLAP
jgi:1-acyl-sn-glycerol-3-phosphate acyltransferase